MNNKIKIVVDGKDFCTCFGVDQLSRVLCALNETSIYAKQPKTRAEGSVDSDEGVTIFIDRAA